PATRTPATSTERSSRPRASARCSSTSRLCRLGIAPGPRGERRHTNCWPRLHSCRRLAIVLWDSHMTNRSSKAEVWQGTLAMMVLKTLDSMGPLHGYGIARRIEQVSGDVLSVNYGTLYPALLKLEQEGYIASEWGVSDNNRKAKYYRLTRAGQKHLHKEAAE